jgi:hypothetical protein
MAGDPSTGAPSPFVIYIKGVPCGHRTGLFTPWRAPPGDSVGAPSTVPPPLLIQGGYGSVHTDGSVRILHPYGPYGPYDGPGSPMGILLSINRKGGRIWIRLYRIQRIRIG